jgi:SAM-dependent methyltransferase
MAVTAPWFETYLERLPGHGRALELGCGNGEDAAALAGLGFDVVASDLLDSQITEARGVVGTRALLRVDHSRSLPFVDGAFDVVFASLSLHYFPRAITLEICDEVHRVLRAGGIFLFRVNASDDVHFGAQDGVEIEPGLRAYAEPGTLMPWTTSAVLYGNYKRFFDERAVREALAGRFAIESLRHVQIERWRRPKQAWECLARAV